MKKLLTSFFIAGAMLVKGEELRFESTANQTSLVELYTSEGCSSCPPAEAWLSKLKSDPRLWKEFVPLAFHVDYWDRLGWRDRFASQNWTQRQYRYASLLHQESVYTPEFIRNGAEWADRNRDVAKSDRKDAGILSALTSDGRTFAISFRGDVRTNVEAHAALLGCGITSKIGAGENNGRQLVHDFVVLEEKSAPMHNESGIWRANLTFESANKDIPQKAVAVWISRESELASVQATGAWLGKIASAKQSQ